MLATNLQPSDISKKSNVVQIHLAANSALCQSVLIEQATRITSRVSAINDRREFGATTVLQVLTHPTDEEEDESLWLKLR
ncbi:MAG: hypothetical protein HC827_02290 [Cyanobacteria bacterium RM1_2_2]|nr:hypothetical protein [Cyanobacteria bacterium RM1_2_2]